MYEHKLNLHFLLQSLPLPLPSSSCYHLCTDEHNDPREAATPVYRPVRSHNLRQSSCLCIDIHKDCIIIAPTSCHWPSSSTGAWMGSGSQASYTTTLTRPFWSNSPLIDWYSWSSSSSCCYQGQVAVVVEMSSHMSFVVEVEWIPSVFGILWSLARILLSCPLCSSAYRSPSPVIPLTMHPNLPCRPRK